METGRGMGSQMRREVEGVASRWALMPGGPDDWVGGVAMTS